MSLHCVLKAPHTYKGIQSRTSLRVTSFHNMKKIPVQQLPIGTVVLLWGRSPSHTDPLNQGIWAEWLMLLRTVGNGALLWEECLHIINELLWHLCLNGCSHKCLRTYRTSFTLKSEKLRHVLLPSMVRITAINTTKALQRLLNIFLTRLTESVEPKPWLDTPPTLSDKIHKIRLTQNRCHSECQQNTRHSKDNRFSPNYRLIPQEPANSGQHHQNTMEQVLTESVWEAGGVC